MLKKICFGTHYIIWKNILTEIIFQYLIAEMSREFRVMLSCTTTAFDFLMLLR